MKNLHLLLLSNTILYTIVLTILYPSSVRIIRDLGVSLNGYSIVALSLSHYMVEHWITITLILLSTALINYYLYPFSNFIKVVILNIFVWMLVYLIFALSLPLLNHR